MARFFTRRSAVVAAFVVATGVGAQVAAAQTPQVRVGGDVKAPAKLKHVEPVYPEAERAAGREGAVTMDITIGTDGFVTDAKVLNPEPPFAAPALAAVRQWRYTPTLLNGQPVEVLMTVTIKFAPGLDQNQSERVRAGGVVSEPRLIKHVAPVYPPDAVAAQLSGMVILDVVIGKDGSVVDAKVLRPIPMFEAAALEAVRQWKYTPSTLNGEPVEVLLIVTVHFKLQE